MINTIINGDCLDVMSSIPDESIDMILCDLPYGVSKCKWDIIIPFDKLWKQYERIIKKDKAIVLTATQPFTSMLVMSNLNLFKYSWIYQKSKATNFLNAKINPMKYHEDVLVFGIGKVNYFPQMIQGNPYVKTHRNEKNGVYNKSTRKNGDIFINKGTRYPSSIIPVISNHSGIGQKHPSEKPVQLFEYLIKTYTQENDVVLDNCIGSGTTAVAALKTNRKFIGIEKEQQYCDIANVRIKDI